MKLPASTLRRTPHVRQNPVRPLSRALRSPRYVMRGTNRIPSSLALVVVIVAALGACTDERSVAPGSAPGAIPWVTSDVAQRLDPHGQFVLAGAGSTELTEQQAAVFARDYVRMGARWIPKVWEGERGASIDFNDLRLCPRAYYVNAAVKPDENSSQAVRELLGPRWLLSMCSGAGIPIISVSVSALATEIHDEQGHIVGPGGNQIRAAGIPTPLTSVPVTPEDAARIAYESTGRRVAAVPELVLPPPRFPAQLAKWRIQLEGPVTVRGSISGAATTTTELYLGFGGTWQSTGLQLGSADPGATSFHDAGAHGALVGLATLSGRATRFEPVTVERP